MRVNLKVEFKDKDKVKSLWAKWDLAQKTWYVENVENLEHFLPWIDEKLKKPVKTPIQVKPEKQKSNKPKNNNKFHKNKNKDNKKQWFTL